MSSLSATPVRASRLCRQDAMVTRLWSDNTETLSDIPASNCTGRQVDKI